MTLTKKAYDILDADIYDNGHAQYIAIIGDDVYMTRAVGEDASTRGFMAFEYIGERKDYEGQRLGNPITFDELSPEAKRSLQYVLNDMNEDKNLEYEESLSEHGDMEGVLEDLLKKESAQETSTALAMLHLANTIDFLNE